MEVLKECLFKDPFESRSRFLNIRDGGKDGYHMNDDEYFCCECEYVKCDHINDATHLKESSRLYLSLICPICIFKIGKLCNRSDGDCCIKRMEGRDKFFDISDAVRFFQNCYHFSYERILRFMHQR